MSDTNTPITDPDNHVDEWFEHATDEPVHMESHGDFNNFGVFATLAVTIVGTVAVAFFAIKWTDSLVRDQEAKVVEGSTLKKAEQVEAWKIWNRDLHGDPEWIDQTAGTISLPLDIASRRTLERYNSGG